MSCYYHTKREMLVLKCDACGKQVDIAQYRTDRTLKNNYIRENGWRTMKHHEKWMDICPDCKKAFEEAKRELWIATIGGAT